MNDILSLASNDNCVTSMNFTDDLEINIETWDRKNLTLVCRGSLKAEVNGSPQFEIGEISFIGFADFSDIWEIEFVSENQGCKDCSEMIIYDPWESKKPLLRIIAEEFFIRQNISSAAI